MDRLVPISPIFLENAPTLSDPYRSISDFH